jgi:hypothetical protein
VKFINTDGVVFVGTGSEWFWAALTGLVLAGTFVAIYRQLRLQRVQMRENNKVLRSQAHYNALSLLQRPWELLIEDVGLAEIVNSGYANAEALSETDWARFSAYSFMQFNGWEYCYYQYRDGSIPKELWVGADNTLRAWIDTKPGLARFWSESRISFDEPFRSEVDQQFASKPVQTGR